MEVAARRCIWKDSVSQSGTVLVVEASEASMNVIIKKGALATGSKSVKVDWGDGSRGEYPEIADTTHAYESPGTYVITISDDLRSFGFVGDRSEDAKRQMLRELVSVGSRVTLIESYGFNNCRNMRGSIRLPNVTQINNYAFGTTLGIDDFDLPSLVTLAQVSFYANPSPTQIHADNVTLIQSLFFDYYGMHLTDIYVRGRTSDEVKAMYHFPFKAHAGARFHCADGVLRPDGTLEE